MGRHTAKDRQLRFTGESSTHTHAHIEIHTRTNLALHRSALPQAVTYNNAFFGRDWCGAALKLPLYIYTPLILYRTSLGGEGNMRMNTIYGYTAELGGARTGAFQTWRGGAYVKSVRAAFDELLNNYRYLVLRRTIWIR